MTIKQTSVNVDVDKWNILKAKGYKLQDIIEDSFNALLEIEDKEPVELIKQKEYLENKLVVLNSEKDNTEKTLETLIKRTAKEYDDKIESTISKLTEEKTKELNDLQEEKEITLNNYDTKINELKVKINLLSKEVGAERINLIESEKEEIRNKEYNDLYLLLKDYSGNYNNPIVLDRIYIYAEKYDLNPNDVATDLVNKFNKEFYD